jgi:hypothetical protein
MREIKPGTIVRLRRNGKIMGTVVKIGKFDNCDVNQGQPKYSVLWFGRSDIKHNFDKYEIQVVLRSNTADL